MARVTLAAASKRRPASQARRGCNRHRNLKHVTTTSAPSAWPHGDDPGQAVLGSQLVVVRF